MAPNIAQSLPNSSGTDHYSSDFDENFIPWTGPRRKTGSFVMPRLPLSKTLPLFDTGDDYEPRTSPEDLFPRLSRQPKPVEYDLTANSTWNRRVFP